MVDTTERRQLKKGSISILLSLVIMVSVFSIGFSGAAVAAGPNISSVDFPDPSLTGTETAEVRVSGTVDTGYQSSVFS